jgi:hypothetical protein
MVCPVNFMSVDRGYTKVPGAARQSNVVRSATRRTLDVLLFASRFRPNSSWKWNAFLFIVTTDTEWCTLMWIFIYFFDKVVIWSIVVENYHSASFWLLICAFINTHYIHILQVMFTLLTNFMNHISSEAYSNSCSDSPPFYGTQRFIVCSPLNHILSQLNPTRIHPITWNSILTWFFHLCLCIPSGPFLSAFLQYNSISIDYKHTIRATCSTHLILLFGLFNGGFNCWDCIASKGSAVRE